MKLSDADMRAMRADQFLHRGPWNRDPEANLRIVTFDLEHLFERPVRIAEKSRLALWPTFATNLSRRRLWVPRGFGAREPRHRAPLLAHETVHFRQRDAYGDSRFNRLYLVSARQRCRFEVPAYREGLRVHRAQNSPPCALRQAADRIVATLRRTYLVNVRRDPGIDREIVAALLEELD